LGDGSKSKLISGAVALETLREISSNKLCADCRAPDPDWSSINLGIVVCIECSGIHRSLGVHISKVRSLPLDEWGLELVEMMKAIGNEQANLIWEANLPPDFRRVFPEDDREAKKEFILAKYASKNFVTTEYKELDQAALDQKLLEAVRGEDVCASVKLVVSGANTKAVDPETRQPALHAAVEAGHVTQIEFLLQNGADSLAVDANDLKVDEVAKKFERLEMVQWLQQAMAKAVVVSETEDFDDEARNKYRCGFLYKTGGSNKFWKRRWFIFDEGALRYFKLKEDREPAGVLPIIIIFHLIFLSLFSSSPCQGNFARGYDIDLSEGGPFGDEAILL